MSDSYEHDSRWFLRERVHDGLKPVARPEAEPADGGRRVNTLIKNRLQQALEKQFASILTPRRSCAEMATTLAQLEAEKQTQALALIATICSTDLELGFSFAGRASRVFHTLDDEEVEAFLDAVMHAYDRRGLGAGISVIEDVAGFARSERARAERVGFEDVVSRLRPFVIGLGGRTLELRADRQAWTDTDTIYLPEYLGGHGDKDYKRRLYRAMAIYLWAQNWFGSWRLEVIEHFSKGRITPETLKTYGALEYVRLGACLGRELPGAWRDMKTLQAADDGSDQWQALTAPLRAPQASCTDSIELIGRAGGLQPPALPIWLGELRPREVSEAFERRSERDRVRLQIALGKLASESDDAAAPDADHAPAWRNAGRQFTLAQAQAGRRQNRIVLELDGAPVVPPSDVQGAIASILQDRGEVPDEYMVASAGGNYEGDDKDATQNTAYHPLFDDSGVYRYAEWDYARGRFRPDYCVLRELDVDPVQDDFIERTRSEHVGALKSIRRSFEALMTQARLERRQRHGDDIDVDALIQAQSDLVAGREMSDELYTALRDHDRSLAAMFMIDMSGSTKGWVNDAERQALVLLCEAMASLKDRYAIYGFSGRTHKRCETYRVKRFDEHYDDAVRARISGIRPRGYTRMGVAIRHLSGLLAQEAARTRVLITLSDGKPEDYRSYRGRYGVEDTRHALLEARRAGVQAFCITIDREAGDYLPHMYGPANYTVVTDIAQLPVKVADIYRRLTT